MDTGVESTIPKPFVFVLMPFETKYDDIYKFGIKGAANDAGAYAERLDEQIFTEGMLDRIFNQINKADVIVADMTGRNPNVFYEVGYAHAIGKIVLLVTQDGNDIPFDLKHHQHIVYKGSIETLKSELVTRIEWAIIENKKRLQPGSLERFSIRILGIDIPTSIRAVEVPQVIGTIPYMEFALTFDLRNDSLETTSGISHVYLFCEEDSKLVPYEYKQWFIANALRKVDMNLSSKMTYTSYPEDTTVKAEPLSSFRANLVDAFDGLTTQYRLPITFPALPPGAIEGTSINLMFVNDATEVDSLFRIRLHSSRQYHDFTFRIKMEYELKLEDFDDKKEKD